MLFELFSFNERLMTLFKRYLINLMDVKTGPASCMDHALGSIIPTAAIAVETSCADWARYSP